MRTTYTGLVDTKYLDQIVTLTGWVHRRRDHGGVIFVDLRDREGIAQVVIDPDRPDAFKLAETLRNEFCIRVTGTVPRARKASRNKPAAMLLPRCPPKWPSQAGSAKL